MDDLEFVLGTLSVLFGIFAIITSILSFKKLPIGYLSGYIQKVIFSTIMITLSYTWHTLRELFQWKEKIGVYMEYPEYIFGIGAFIFLAIASYRLYELSKGFCFNKKSKSKQY